MVQKQEGHCLGPGGSSGFQKFPARSRRDRHPGGLSRQTRGALEGSRRDRHPGGFSRQTREAESLVDYSNHKESTSKPKDQNEGQGKVWRDRSPRKETHRDNTSLRHQESSSWKGKAKDAQGLRKPSSSKCFICDGDHWARQCPQRQALSSLLARYQEENDVDGCQEGAHIGSLQLLNGIQSTPKIETKGLLFVDVAINGKATRAMVDTGASHNFISPEEATRLGVKVTGVKGSIKAVNSAAKPIHGIAQKVKTDIGTWSGHLNFSIVPMDDYKLILGIEFLDQVKAIPMPFVNAISITEGNQACVVPMIRGTKQESKVLSALQLEEEDTNRGSLETSMLAFPTCYKRKSRAQHRGAKRRRHQADKMQRPPKFKEGSTHRGRKSKIRRSISTIPRRPRDEGIAGLSGGGCHDPPSCPRTIEKGPCQSRTEGRAARDLGSQDGSEARGALPGTRGFQKFPARSRRDRHPGGLSRQTRGAPEGSRRDRHPGGVSRQTRATASHENQKKKKKKHKGKKKQNQFFVESRHHHQSNGGHKLIVLKEPTGREIEQRYEVGRELGRGEFGITYLCTKKETGETFACKSISKKKLRTTVDIEDVRREVEIMKHLPEHQNIVTLKDTYEDDNAVHLVMELCEGGELFDSIVARGHYAERAAAAVTKTIIEVVQMCHKHGVIHRDLKPENFLFQNNKETAVLKVIDFGLSVFFKPGERFNEIVGSPYYMAPEVLKRNYGPEVDIWSAGVILYILLCGVPPFWADTEQGVAQAIIRSVLEFKRDPWPRVSDAAKDLVKKMLNPDPKRRLTAQEVLGKLPSLVAKCNNAPNVSLSEILKARLKQFSVMNKLKKRALRVIAEHLSVEEVACIKEGFQVMDTSNRGKINIDELRVGLHKLGHIISDADLQILIKAGDVDRDGYLDYGKFVAILFHLRKMGDDSHLKKAFQFFDRNQSGYIEIDELRDELGDELETNCEEVIGAIMNDVDTNKVHASKLNAKFCFMNLQDGRISYDEFAAMMKAGTDWRKASRQYSQERFDNLGQKLMKDASL
ncbi:hypothetical protein V6N13_001992 [Hibiscus sabdariffa]